MKEKSRGIFERRKLDENIPTGDAGTSWEIGYDRIKWRFIWKI